jgi:RecB family exonuclease
MRRALRVLGARALDAQVCCEVGVHVEAVRDDVRALAEPLHIVVPSRSLRLHLGALLVEHFGGALVGVRIVVLEGLARELAAQSARAPLSDAAYPLVVRRHAREEAALSERLDALLDGYGSVVASVDDLLDAGFDAVHRDALEARLAEADVGAAAALRARAVLRVAARTARALDAALIDHRSRLLARARARLEADPERALPGRGVLIVGFSDATGAQADLIEALLRLRDAQLLLLQPPALPVGTSPAHDAPYGARFRERMAAVCGGIEDVAGAAPGAARMRILEAPGPEAEVRAVAEQLRRLLDAGARPEALAVVARDLGQHGLPLRRHFGRLGIPFSGLGARGPAGPARRQLDALLLALERGGETPAERWLEAVDRVESGARAAAGLSISERADLREALHIAGVARVSDLVALPPPTDDIRLQTRRGFEPGASDAPGRAPRRLLPAAAWRGAQGAAVSLCAQHASWPARAALEQHLAALRNTLDTVLGWRDEAPGRAALETALLCDAAAPPREFEMDRDEFLLLLRHALSDSGWAPLGGMGGGVQVLGALEMRARSFEHVFAIGMNRGVFPRSVAEDPLLEDALRRLLRDLLPELPVKGDGVDEERQLFAQLLASSADVTLCWHSADEDGRACAASPLLEGLLGDATVEYAPPAPPAGAPSGAEAAPRTAFEHAVHSGCAGAPHAYASALALALEEAGSTPSAAPALAAARCAVVRELDPPAALRGAPGPYLGLIGAPVDAADPRRAALYVTTLEQTARCPWRAFVRQLLRVAPVPDALGALPSGSDPVALGRLVHAVLEAVAAPAAAGPVNWPSPARLDAILMRCAAAQVHSDGVALAGHARVLALRAYPYLEVARRLDWAEDGAGPRVEDVERERSFSWPDARGIPRELRFRADRVDRSGPGLLRLTDYKVGRPYAEQKRPEKRIEALRQRIARGDALQAVAYALGGGPGATGRYLFLRPDLDDALRVLELDAAPHWREPFERAVRCVLEAWDHGSFVPRLREPGRDVEPPACRSCEVREACVRGDSGARGRLVQWLEADPAAQPQDATERSARGIWQLADAQA